MNIASSIEQRAGYVVVRVEGEPSLDEMLAFIVGAGHASAHWPSRRVLFDLRGVRTLKAFTDHYALGEAVARYLSHMHKLASVVPVDRITRASEKTARRSGTNLSVFTDEAEAIAWLLSDAP